VLLHVATNSGGLIAAHAVAARSRRRGSGAALPRASKAKAP
jgi:hypothetical protein